MQPRALILDGPEGATVRLAPRLVRGIAWTGAGRVASVHLSDDGGQTLAAARLLGKHQRHTWRQWDLAWTPKRAGEATLLARATDAKGVSQPLEPVWNALGYGNNAALPRHLVIAHAVERHSA